MAVRTPCGKTFPSHFSIIPSSKKWVYHAIFRLAILELYGDKVCSMNRLVLTDEEDAEYRPFESLIATNDKFKSSKVMLCIFHAIWQPFKRDIYVDPQMETNSIRKRGLPIWEYSTLPAHFRTGTPHMEMGSLFLATSTSRIEESSPKFWTENQDFPALS
jgi:hypothetical protein